MKSTHLSSNNPRLDLRLAAYAAAGAALAGPALAPSAQASVVYSGPVTIAVPNTIDGVYLDLVTGVNSTSTFTGYDFNPFGSTALEFYEPASTTLDAIVGTAAAGATAETPLVSTVSATSGFVTSVVAGTAFDTIGTEYAGIKFKNDTTGVVNYGWVELVTTSTTGFPATIVGYAYENTGAAITVGQIASVPEPGTTAALGFGALSLGAAGVRRWRKSKQAVA